MLHDVECQVTGTFPGTTSVAAAPTTVREVDVACQASLGNARLKAQNVGHEATSQVPWSFDFYYPLFALCHPKQLVVGARCQ
ncbi:hypothetical protein WJX72_005614 [[Myrmecia] bisecta]|uniref:Uncharacterized protein n=1 Tax=[Myrmecia] bisecta TaxID=41462 RepID=A0AAW1PGQ4_9CHLO